MTHIHAGVIEGLKEQELIQLTPMVMVARIAMITTVTISSIRVKPRFFVIDLLVHSGKRIL